MKRCPARWLTVALTLTGLHAGLPETHAQSAGTDTSISGALVAAYPQFLASPTDDAVVWKDGTRMLLAPAGSPQIDPSQLSQSQIEERFAQPTLRDLFLWPYPLATPAPPPRPPADPGRIRVAAFFNKMYGDCTKGEVAPRLVPVAWLPRQKGGMVRVTRINGVADKVAALSAELDTLPASFRKFLTPAAGAYNCRAIAGTERSSAHGWGIAIDIALSHAHYWRWTKPDGSGQRPYRNAIPPEIVRIFEGHGFIWGGKWHHYDTMHFEYRPEILATGTK